jgi:hypothetical protein
VVDLEDGARIPFRRPIAADKGARVGRKKNPTSESRNSPASGFRNPTPFAYCRRGETFNDFNPAANFGNPKFYIDYGGSSQALPYLGVIVAAKSPD